MAKRVKKLTPLGKRFSTFRGKKLDWKFYFTIVFSTLVFVLFPIGYGTWIAIINLKNHGVNAALSWSNPWLILALLSFISIIGYAIYRIWMSYPIITLYEGGVVIQKNFFRTIPIPWRNIEGIRESLKWDIFLGKVIKRRLFADLFYNQKSSIKLRDNIENLPELIYAIKHKIYPIINLKITKNLGQEKWIPFGSILMHNNGIKIKRRRVYQQDKYLPWENIKTVTINNGLITIIDRNNNNHHQLSISKIINFELMWNLIAKEANI